MNYYMLEFYAPFPASLNFVKNIAALGWCTTFVPHFHFQL